ncbi:MAG TPA: Uma2 family endonuclease [Gammaproteobacteria bacterium]|jgi:Uma2 family endonuclease
MISRPNIPFTYDDYKTLTASTDDRYELIDGDLYMVPAPSVTHQVVAKNLVFLLEHHVRAAKCGRVLGAPLDIVLGEGDERSVVQPDILFISNARAGIVTDSEIVGAPDLVVEVLSPSSLKRDRSLKMSLYARSGVLEYWIVDPKLQSVDVFSLGARGPIASVVYRLGDRLESEVVSGFEAPVSDVFRAT